MMPLPRTLGRASALAALLVLAASLGLSAPAAAVPVSLVLGSGIQPGPGSVPAFHYSYLHNATQRCEVIAGVQFCQSGDQKFDLLGSLTADLTGLVLSNIQGTISVAGGPDIVVTDGLIDFASSAAYTFGGSIETSTHGTFHFLDYNFAGLANSFDGSNLFLWGNNWDTGNPGDPSPFARFGLDIGATVVAVPEPRLALALALGFGVLASARGRKCP